MTNGQLMGGVSIIVPAAGSSARMGDGRRKQYIPLNGKPMLQHVIEKMLALEARQIMVALAADDNAFESVPGHDRCRVVVGGATRSGSVINALASLDCDDDDWVMVHDAARPCVLNDDIARLIATVGNDPVGGILSTPVVETVKRSEDGERISATVSRDGLWLAQTPQLFRFGTLEQALDRAQKKGIEPTDEASAVEMMGLMPILVEGSRRNIKVTTKADVELAEYYLRTETA